MWDRKSKHRFKYLRIYMIKVALLTSGQSMNYSIHDIGTTN